MSAPQLTLYLQGQGAVGADQLNTFMQTCDGVAQMRSITGVSGMKIYAGGRVIDGDGGGGVYYWSGNSTAPDDGNTVIVPTGAVAGAWVLIAPHTPAIVAFPVYASPPSNPITGQCYYDSTLNGAYLWNGVTWKQFTLT